MGDLKHCYKCMEEYDAELHVCPHCGYDENTPHNPMYIAPGTLLHEKYLCGILLEFNGAMSEVGDLLKPEVFYVDAHGKIFDAIVKIYGRGDMVDILTVTHELKKSGLLDSVGGPLYISQLIYKVSSHAHIHYHTMIILQEFIARETIRLNQQAMQSAYDGEDVLDLIPETIAKLEASIASSIRRRATPTSGAGRPARAKARKRNA